MGRIIGLLLLALSLCIGGTEVTAAPVNLSSFTAESGVTESGGLVTFTEDSSFAAIYFFNDGFHVGNNALSLSFDYTLQLGASDLNDSLTFDLNYGSLLTVTSSEAGHFSVDLTPYQGKPVSLAWGLIWGGDLGDAGTATATVSNIDLVSRVPEPNAGLLLVLALPILFLVKGRRIGNIL